MDRIDYEPLERSAELTDGRCLRTAQGVAHSTLTGGWLELILQLRKNSRLWKNRLQRRRRYRIDLAAHMAECDANYLRLLKLIPELRERDERTLTVRVADEDVTVCFRVLERCPYTTMIELTQLPLIEGLAFELPAPRIVMRLYHDAKSAEVVEYQNERHFKPTYSYPNGEMRQRDEKAQLNRFLSEYLAACLEHGACADQRVVLADY